MFALALRNVFRNTRRSVLTASAIAFAVLLLAFAYSMNNGQYRTMIDNGTRLMTGHAQIQAPGYLQDPSIRKTVTGTAALQRDIGALPSVRNVRPRAEAFALVSVNEKGFGAQVVGVDAAAERSFAMLPERLSSGRYLAPGGTPEAVIGAALARNLGAKLGDDLIVLGTGKDGSVAAFAAQIVGFIESGIPELDRALVQVPIDEFRTAFAFEDEATALIITFESPEVAGTHLPAIARVLGQNANSAQVIPWQRLVPDLVQAIEFDRVSNLFVFALLVAMVVFSIANTFVMTVFERTREFGMLLAIGMTPPRLQALVQLEALIVCTAGVVLGSLLALAIVLVLASIGVPLPGRAGEMAARFRLPDRIYPVISLWALVLPGLLVLAATQLAAAIPTLRVRYLSPVAALRGD